MTPDELQTEVDRLRKQLTDARETVTLYANELLKHGVSPAGLMFAGMQRSARICECDDGSQVERLFFLPVPVGRDKWRNALVSYVPASTNNMFGSEFNAATERAIGREPDCHLKGVPVWYDCVTVAEP